MIAIRGTGSSVPDARLTNADLEKLVETSDEWILSRTGIRERRMLSPDEATSDIATRAGQAALEMAGLGPGDLDLVIVATLTPDMFTPSTANLVQRNLGGGRSIPSFDLNAACSGFVYGLDVSRCMIASGGYRRVLLIGAESMTRFMDYQDRGTCILFGDAAGAVVLEKAEGEGGVLATTLRSDGQYWDLIHMPGGAARRPASHEVIDRREHYIRMEGRQTFKVAVQSLEQVAIETLERVGWSIDDVDWVLAHQANRRIVDAATERLGVPSEKVPMNVERYGNTSAASIPVLLDECNRAGRFEPGHKLLLVTFGAGATWGASAIEWTRPR